MNLIRVRLCTLSPQGSLEPAEGRIGDSEEEKKCQRSAETKSGLQTVIHEEQIQRSEWEKKEIEQLAEEEGGESKQLE